MVPRGLVVAISAGVVAAGALGLLFLTLFDGRDLTFVEGPSVSLLTDMQRYEAGEPVEIRIVNSGTIQLLSGDGSSGMRIRALDTTLIYSAPGLGADLLEPGQEVLLSWNQTRNSGAQALQGVYKIEVVLESADGILVSDSVAIEIL